MEKEILARCKVLFGIALSVILSAPFIDLNQINFFLGVVFR
jgi:hypothetical protein